MLVSPGCLAGLGGIDLVSVSPSAALKRLDEIQRKAMEERPSSPSDADATLYGCAKVALGILASLNERARRKLAPDALAVMNRIPPFMGLINNPTRVRFSGVAQRAFTGGRDYGKQAKKLGVGVPSVVIGSVDRADIKPGVRLRLLLLRLRYLYKTGDLVKKARVIAKLEMLINAIDEQDTQTIGEIMESEIGAVLSQAVSDPKISLPFVGVGIAALAGMFVWGFSKGK